MAASKKEEEEALAAEEALRVAEEAASKAKKEGDAFEAAKLEAEATTARITAVRERAEANAAAEEAAVRKAKENEAFKQSAEAAAARLAAEKKEMRQDTAAREVQRLHRGNMGRLKAVVKTQERAEVSADVIQIQSLQKSDVGRHAELEIVREGNKFRKLPLQELDETTRTKQFALALACYEKAISWSMEHDTYAADAYYGAGFIYRKTNRNEEAVEHFMQCVTLYPEGRKGVVWDNLGASLLKMGKYVEAIEAFKEACKMDDSNPNFRKALAHAEQAYRPIKLRAMKFKQLLKKKAIVGEDSEPKESGGEKTASLVVALQQRQAAMATSKAKQLGKLKAAATAMSTLGHFTVGGSAVVGEESKSRRSEKMKAVLNASKIGSQREEKGKGGNKGVEGGKGSKGDKKGGPPPLSSSRLKSKSKLKTAAVAAVVAGTTLQKESEDPPKPKWLNEDAEA